MLAFGAQRMVMILRLFVIFLVKLVIRGKHFFRQQWELRVVSFEHPIQSECIVSKSPVQDDPKPTG